MGNWIVVAIYEIPHSDNTETESAHVETIDMKLAYPIYLKGQSKDDIISFINFFTDLYMMKSSRRTQLWKMLTADEATPKDWLFEDADPETWYRMVGVWKKYASKYLPIFDDYVTNLNLYLKRKSRYLKHCKKLETAKNERDKLVQEIEIERIKLERLKNELERRGLSPLLS